MNDLDLCL